MVSRPLDFVKLGSVGRFSVDYWILEYLLENVNKEIILKDDEHHVNINLDKVENFYYFHSYIMYYHF